MFDFRKFVFPDKVNLTLSGKLYQFIYYFIIKNKTFYQHD